jgi:hypothetical protein
MTERVPYGFTIELDAEGIPRILLEAIDAALPVLRTGQLGFELREDMTLEEAQELADTLNEHVTGVTYAASSTT